MKERTVSRILSFAMWISIAMAAISIISLCFVCTRALGAEFTAETENGAQWDELAIESLKYGAEERVIDLPKDSGKWYISIIGDPKNAQYKSILRRFSHDKNLRALRAQVHFWIVPTTGPAYKERYEKNTKVLPTIRVQKNDGEVVWEAAAQGIPRTANGLYVAIKNSSLKAMAILPWRRNGTVLPWRDQMERKYQPVPQPLPLPTPVLVDPEPAPIDNGGPPEFEDTGPARWVVVLSAIASALAGGGYGLFSQWKKTIAG